MIYLKNFPNIRQIKRITFQLLLLAVLALLSFDCNAQINLSGRITDESGAALSNVSIKQINSTKGAISDNEGFYSLTIASPSKVQFSYVGYVSIQIAIDKDTVVNLTMIPSSGDLNEVVVVGYGAQKRSNIASAVSVIQSGDLARSTATTTSGALVGKASGINFRQSSGVPGSITNVQIRNFGEPLYVIDGVMSDGGTFNNLNINDIENITILKDGAAAIYGFKAANGVILVTTKGGKFNRKPTVTLNSYYGWQQWFRYPKLLSAYEWKFANLMRDVNNGTYNGDVAADLEMLEKWKIGYYDSAAGEDYRGFDWKKNYVSEAAPLRYTNVSVSGGGDKVGYFLSFGTTNQDAVFKDYNFKRYNMISKIDAKLERRLNVGLKLQGRIEKRSNPGMPGVDDYEAARVNIFELAPIYRPYANDNPQYLNAIPSRFGQNMAAITKSIAGTYTSNWYVMQTDWYAEYLTPVKGLNIKGLYSLNFKNNVVDNFEKGWREYTYDKNTNNYIISYDKSASGDTYNLKQRGVGLDYLTQLTLTYDTTFNNKHHITAVAAFETLKNEYKGLSVQQHPIATDLIELLYSDENNVVSDSKNIYTRMSYIFRLGYDYMEKYIISALGRYDGSWKFVDSKRWGFFPSVQVAWNIANEEFIKNSNISKTLNYAKLRFSYGGLGDDNLGGIYPDFSYLPGYNYNPQSALIAPFPNSSIVGQPVNGLNFRQNITSLSWMRSNIINAGIDLGLLKNKLNIEFNVFKRSRTGIPAVPNDLVIPVETGLYALPQNLNSDETVGLDGAINWVDRAKDFKYNIGLNATLARQKFGARYNERFFNSWDEYRYSQKGRWSNVSGNSEMWMWEVIGRFKSQDEIDQYKINIDGENNATVRPGDLIFKDQNGDGLINSYDLRPLGYGGASWPWSDGNGNRMPLLTMGMNLGFEYKGIDMAVDFAGAFMNTFVMDWLMKWGVDRTHNGYYYNNIDVWRHENIFDPTSPWIEGNYPSLGTSSTRWWNTFYTYNVNYLRLRNAMLGYSFPAKWLSKANITKARIYLQGTNLFSIDNLNKLGIDPEITRVDGKDYPQHRVVTLGVQLTF